MAIALNICFISSHRLAMAGVSFPSAEVGLLPVGFLLRKSQNAQNAANCVDSDGTLMCMFVACDLIPIALSACACKALCGYTSACGLDHKDVTLRGGCFGYAQWANLATAAFLLLTPRNPYLGAAMYALADGPLAAALIAWQSAWVFNSAPHVIRCGQLAHS